MAHTQTIPRYIKILTTDLNVEKFVMENEEFDKIEIVSNLSIAMDRLLANSTSKEKRIFQERILNPGDSGEASDETLELRYTEEATKLTVSKLTARLVAVVDDDFVIQEQMKAVLSKTGCVVETFSDGRQFLLAAEHSTYDLIFLDLMMPDIDGFKVLEYLNTKGLSIPVIVLSALSRKETIMRTMEYGIHSYMIKPLEPEKIIRKVEEFLTQEF